MAATKTEGAVSRLSADEAEVMRCVGQLQNMVMGAAVGDGCCDR